MHRSASVRTRFFAHTAAITATVLSQLASASPASSAHSTVAITHVTVIDVASGRAVPDMTVVIQEGRISSVEKSERSAPAAGRIVDGRHKFLIPGFWDMHVHLSYARASALPSLVANGVTGVRDMGSDLAEIDKWRAQIADRTLVGPTILRAGPMLNGEEFNRYQLAVTGGDEARLAVRVLRKVGVDFIKLHRRTSREAYFSIAEECRKYGLPFVGHVPMAVSPSEASDAGQASIEHTETLFEGTFAAANAGRNQAARIAEWRANDARGLFATFIRNGTFVDPTLIAQEALLRLYKSGKANPYTRYIAASARAEAAKVLGPETKQEVLADEPVIYELRRVTGLMAVVGVPLLVGTDLSFLSPPGFSLHDELALLVESGLTPAGALKAATLNPALLLKLDDAGVISRNARADLVLLDENPLDDIRNTRRISAVVLRGTLFERPALDSLLDEAARLAKIN